MRYAYLVLTCVLCTAALCIAQDNTPTSATPSAAPAAPQTQKTQNPRKAEKPSQDQKEPGQGTSKDRLFFAIPNFLTLENAGEVPPLTSKEKFSVIVRSSFDPVQLPWYGFLSAISQAQNSEPGFGQGWGAYGKRLGAYASDGTVENFVVGAILPSILRQDPRYFQSGKGRFLHRTGYAMSRVVLTRGDPGRKQFNFSEVFGSVLASAISTYGYHPRRALRGFSNGTPVYWPSDRTLNNTASVWASQVGYDSMTFMIKEFWPDIRRKLQKHQSR